ncbi:protein scabrous-like [Biomphalaria glabrata]|uniref:Protein scabrous-like n=1 Tax=Biomphalaria glabrata TaxID=6526 RepID=A0A9W2YL08_BIOGL|nr:protein scabrous-like [Biomphalaria glabrata]
MARLFLLLVLCVFVVSLAGSELVIDVQPNVITTEITPQLVINCSITNNEVQQLDLIKSLTLSRYNETIREFDELLALDSLTQNLKQFVRFKYSQISFGNRYITLILHNPTQFDARIYKCNATGDNSEGANISLFAKKAVEYETNSTALIEEIRRIKKDENFCSFKKDDLSDSKQRSRVYFSGSSDIIKERIEPLTLKCTFQVLKTDQNETSRLQSLYILHESKGVIAYVNKDQPVVTSLQGSNIQNVEGEIYDNAIKDSYLQVTWSNLKHSESGKYFCEAHNQYSDGRIDKSSNMLTMTVERPTFDDLVEAIHKLFIQVDGAKESLKAINQNIKNINKDLDFKEQNITSIKEEVIRNQNNIQILSDDSNIKEQNLTSIKEDLSTKQQTFLSIKEDVIINQQNIDKIKQDLNTYRHNMSNIQEHLEVILANLSTASIKVKNQIDEGSTMSYPPRKSCRDVNSTDERVVVTLTSGLKVMCDTKTDGGGWIIFQRRINGKVDFYRGWKEYRDGFGDYAIGEFYLGNEYISKLTSTRNFDLRIDFKFNHKIYFVEFSDFRILNETNNYQLKIGKYKGNASDEFSYHNNMKFSTFDRDNDVDTRNCALQYTGAWWYKDCHFSNLNGQWGSKEYSKGANWESITGYGASVSFVEMKIRER